VRWSVGKRLVVSILLTYLLTSGLGAIGRLAGEPTQSNIQAIMYSGHYIVWAIADAAHTDVWGPIVELIAGLVNAMILIGLSFLIVSLVLRKIKTGTRSGEKGRA
jgi:hypothetical protein